MSARAMFQAIADRRDATADQLRQMALAAVALSADPEPTSLLLTYVRHRDDCDAAAWEQRRAVGQVPSYERPACSCGLDALLAVPQEPPREALKHAAILEDYAHNCPAEIDGGPGIEESLRAGAKALRAVPQEPVIAAAYDALSTAPAPPSAPTGEKT